MIFFCEKKQRIKKIVNILASKWLVCVWKPFWMEKNKVELITNPNDQLVWMAKKHCDFNANLENEEKKRNLKIWNENLSTKLIDQNGHHHSTWKTREEKRRKKKLKWLPYVSMDRDRQEFWIFFSCWITWNTMVKKNIYMSISMMKKK